MLAELDYLPFIKVLQRQPTAYFSKIYGKCSQKINMQNLKLNGYKDDLFDVTLKVQF